MATTDFRFRVSKAVGSPSVQGAAGIETLANHTENPNPHPQYMRKSYVGMGMTFTEHLASRLHHARNHALRNELTTSKLDYERTKLVSLVHDADNYMTESGVKAHVITAYVLNQILDDVGLDGSTEALTYNNLVNSYDTHVVNGQRFAPTWEIFLKLRNSIYPWMVGGTPDNYMLKAGWKEWVEYMYGDTEVDTNFHPLRPGLKVALYASDYVAVDHTAIPSTTVDPVTSAYLTDTKFIPNIVDQAYVNAGYYIVRTSDAAPDPGKTYYYISGNTTYVFSGSSFTSGVTYYEKVYVDFMKVQGTCLTSGCSILEKCCSPDDQSFFDWSNGLDWKFYAGKIASASTDPYSQKLMVWDGRIKLNAGQKIIFSGVVDDAVFVKIGTTIITKQLDNSYWQPYSENKSKGSYDEATKYSFTAPSTGLYSFRLAVYNQLTYGPKASSSSEAYSSDIPFRMSIDNGVTFLPISNESLRDPIFFLPEGSEKEITYTKEVRDRNNYRPDPKPGLLVNMWKAPDVTRSTSIDLSTEYTIGDEQDKAFKHATWQCVMFTGEVQNGSGRHWNEVFGPQITNGCSMLYKTCTADDPTFFDWFNGKDWPYYAGDYTSCAVKPWARRGVGWFGMIYLRAGETVKFTGVVDDHCWIKIDDTWVIDKLGYSEESEVFEYTSTYTGYHPFKLLIRNETTFGPKVSDDNCLRMAINNDNFVNISNESFDQPRFFLPDDCDQEMFWDKGVTLRDRYAIQEMSDRIAEYERRFIHALSTVNHVPDWNTRAACVGVLNTTNHTLTWTVPEGISHGTLNLMFAAESSNGTDSASQTSPGVLSVKMPGLGAQWVEVTYLATFHSTTKYNGVGTNSFGRYECNMTFRVISGMQFQLSLVGSVLHDHSCTINDYEPAE